ncbi:hypothetical protein SGLAM104S_08552 [Streptomyces glaucescens]
MNPLKRPGLRRASVLGPLAATVLVTPGTATGSPDAVRASAPGAQAARSGRHFGAAMAAGRLGDGPCTTVLDREFASVTPENEMKWDTTEPSRGSFCSGPADHHPFGALRRRAALPDAPPRFREQPVRTGLARSASRRAPGPGTSAAARRSGPRRDQTLTIPACRLQCLYPGMNPGAGGDDSLLPRRLGLLTQTDSAR